MDPKEAPGGLEDGVHRLDAMPVPGEGVQASEGLGHLLGGEAALPLKTRK
jgi:hypothetical protein